MTVRILTGDCRTLLREMPAESVQTCVTSPPYFGLRDYGVAGQIGLEPTPDEFVAAMVEVFREVRRVLRKDGTLWLNLGDSYVSTPPGNKGKVIDLDGAYARRQERQLGHGEDAAKIYAKAKVPGLKPKDLLGIPWRVAFALQADGWWLRSSIIWHKPNPMPESVTDRPTSAHENIFLFAKSASYFYDSAAVREPFAETSIDRTKYHDKGKERNRGGRTDGYSTSGVAVPLENGGRNLRNVWSVATQPYSGAHFATFPPDLIEPCIKAGSRPGDTVLDPFGGAGTTGLVADRLGRNAILTDLNPDYSEMSRRRIEDDAGMFASIAAE